MECSELPRLYVIVEGIVKRIWDVGNVEMFVMLQELVGNITPTTDKKCRRAALPVCLPRQSGWRLPGHQRGHA